MKRTLAIVVAMVLTLCSASTALGASGSVGMTLMDGAKTYLSPMYEAYKISEDVVDKYLDQIYGYAIMYLDGAIVYSTETASLLNNKSAEMLIVGYSDMLNALCEARIKYSNGEITKDAFKKQLFITVSVIVASK